VGVDPINVPDIGSIMFGLSGFRVLAAGVVCGELELLVETTADRASCPECGRPAAPHDRREHLLRHVAQGDRPVFVLWCKRIWRCRADDCPKRTWSEQTELAAPKASLSSRVRAWAARRVGQHAETVAATARALGEGWHTAMGAVTEHGAPIVDDPARLSGVDRLAVDEHAWQRANAHRHTRFAIGIVALRCGDGYPARLLDVVPGRSGTALGAWLVARPEQRRRHIHETALDPFRGYLTALREHLPHARRVLEAFHVVKLGFDAVDDVRRRVQQEQAGHRGRNGDPLYGARRLLRRRVDRLKAHHIARLDAALVAGDPHGKVTIAWHAAQALVGAVADPDRAAGLAAARKMIATYIDCPVPEVARLAGTVTRWSGELAACFTERRASNGPAGAINLLTEKIRRLGHGYRNFDNYRLRLLLNCGTTWDRVLTRRIRTGSPRMAA
jgi:transposase